MQKFFEKCFLWTEHAEPNDPTWNVRVCSINIVVWFSEVTFRHWLKAKFTWIAWNFNGPNGIRSTSHWSQKSATENRPTNKTSITLYGSSSKRFFSLCLFEFLGFFIHTFNIIFPWTCTQHNRIYMMFGVRQRYTHTQRYTYTQLTKLVKVSFSKNRIHKICSKNEPNIIIIMMKEKPEKIPRAKKSCLSLFVVILLSWYSEYSLEF